MSLSKVLRPILSGWLLSVGAPTSAVVRERCCAASKPVIDVRCGEDGPALHKERDSPDLDIRSSPTQHLVASVA